MQTLSISNLELSVSIAVLCVGAIMLLEAFITVQGKGIDVNGELPYMTFGILFSIIAPIYIEILGPLSKGWYWYVLIAVIMIYAFFGYIRVKGFTIRFYNENTKKVSEALEKVLKQQKLNYKKDTHTPSSGMIIRYTLDSPKIPVQIMENRASILKKPCIELLAAEALWNKEFMRALLDMIKIQRKNRTKNEAIQIVRIRLFAGLITLCFGLYMFLSR